MKVDLPAGLEKYLLEKLDTGCYVDASEVICEALRLLKGRDKFYEAKINPLQSSVDKSPSDDEQVENES
jgi:putative addiction module CopG family antidote